MDDLRPVTNYKSLNWECPTCGQKLTAVRDEERIRWVVCIPCRHCWQSMSMSPRRFFWVLDGPLPSRVQILLGER